MESKKSNTGILIIIMMSFIVMVLLCICVLVGVISFRKFTEKTTEIINYPEIEAEKERSANIGIPGEEQPEDFKIPSGDNLPEIIENDNSEGFVFDSIINFPIVIDENAEFNYSPVETVYYYYIDDFYQRYDGEVIVGSPRITDDKVEIDLTVDGVQSEIWFVQSEPYADGSYTVSVGIPNAGADEVFYLEHTANGVSWGIVEIEEVSF